MSGTIDVADLRVGMYVHLDLGWMSHPFPVGSFRIADEEQIRKIRGLGMQRLRWSPQRSLQAMPVASGAAQAAASAAAVPAVDAAAPGAAAGPQERLALCQRQFDEAGGAWRDAHALVRTEPQRARAANEALTRALLDKMLVDGDLCIRLLSCNAGDRAGAHAVNVAVISLLMGRVFGLQQAEMLDLGVGALLHDVGKIDLPERLRHADARSSAEDLAAYREHVAHGVAHGRRMGLAPGALLVLGQHHEHADGTGFPQRLKTDRLSLAARIVALVDRYDNLCNPPSLTQACTPHEALSLLFTQAQPKFDTGMLNAFIRMMGVYPAGSVVQLTDERYALVTSVNSTRPLKPNVLVHDPAQPPEEALHLNLMTTPDLGIRRSLKPAQLPADAFETLRPRPRVAYFFESAPLPLADAADRVLA